jgi:CO/xanthine dehydrogenase Mo-binding subunit
MKFAAMSRRSFLKAGALAGVAVYVAPFGSKAFAELFEQKLLTPVNWDGKDGSVKWRIDGMSKVTGTKVFSYDIRASDMPHWPNQQAHALLLRVTRADRPYVGYNLSMLTDELKPDRVVTAADLARDGIKLPGFFGDDMLLPEGKIAAYLGQAVAFLIYKDFARFRFAKDRLKFRTDVILYGAASAPLARDPWGVFRFVRVGGATPFADDVFSSLNNAPVFPSGMDKHLPVWPEPGEHGALPALGMFHATQIRKELDQPPADWLVFEREYNSQSCEPAALEPDNANCWYDPAQQALHIVAASQGPLDVLEGAAEMIAGFKAAFPVKQVFIHPTPTVGYGAKDHHLLPFYGITAALYADGRPVRLANDRYEQFQTGLKRHAFKMHYRIAVDRKSGMFQAFVGDFDANGGGRANFSAVVAKVGATAAQSIYYFPKNDLVAIAAASRALDAGSMRGFGTTQTMTATELAVDEIAATLGIDPIELRLKNVLKSGMKNTQGAVPAGAVRADEILLKARAHPMWVNRARAKADYEARHPGHRYGVGFACTQKDYGTGAESSFAKVEIAPDGGVSLWHSGTEIGTGMSTSQAVAVTRWLPLPAASARFAETDWTDLPMVSSGNPWIMPQAEQDKLAANPRWTPFYASPASATNSAFYYTQSTQEAARTLFMHGLWPAAMAIWNEGIAGGQAAGLTVRVEDAHWADGKLSAGGLEALPYRRIVEKAHAMSLPTGVAVHVFNRWRWAEADFTLEGKPVRLPIDGLSLRRGQGKYEVQQRVKAYYPETRMNNAAVTYYTAIGALVELAVDEGSGKVAILAHHSIAECGTQLTPQLVSGQIQGGTAMGIGHALYESLPLYEDGPGDGTWNFNRYHLPLARDVAVWTQTAEVLPPISPTDPAKGLAEVVMIPVVGAIVNGIAHAIGHRFADLPVTPQKILEVLA